MIIIAAIIIATPLFSIAKALLEIAKSINNKR